MSSTNRGAERRIDDQYSKFVASKRIAPAMYGVDPSDINPMLFDFQRAIVAWAIRRGRAAIFADCGLGKTLMQLEWARQSGSHVLIASPIAVADQTIREAAKLGIAARKVDRPSDGSIEITNYEKLHHFVGHPYDAIVLDESGILKSLDGKTRTMLIREFSGIPRRLCCTATPAPNDLAELANHAEFLGVMSRVEMLASFFVHDSDRSGGDGWRLKGHARDAFWRWVAKWAVYARMPSDLGFYDGDFKLPGIDIRQETVTSNWRPDGMLFTTGLGGIGDRRQARRATIDARVARAAEIVSSTGEQWLAWCGLNDEGDALEDALIGRCEQIAGRHTDDEKIDKCNRWMAGETQTLITKPSIFGWGMNWQHCHNMLFLGLGDSYEQYYQAMRRCWRFGQKHRVNVVIVTSDSEQCVADNVRRKEADASALAEGIVKHAKDAMRAEVVGGDSEQRTYNPTKKMIAPPWAKENAA